MIATGSIRSIAKKIIAPTQVIHGDIDPLIRLAAGKDTAKHIPRARLHIEKGLKHDFPKSFLPRLSELISSNALRANAQNN